MRNGASSRITMKTGCARSFCDKLEHSKARPLCDLTGGIHLHTVRAPDERTLDRVIAGLKEKGFLLEEEN